MQPGQTRCPALRATWMKTPISPAATITGSAGDRLARGVETASARTRLNTATRVRDAGETSIE